MTLYSENSEHSSKSKETFHLIMCCNLFSFVNWSAVSLARVLNKPIESERYDLWPQKWNDLWPLNLICLNDIQMTNDPKIDAEMIPKNWFEWSLKMLIY